MSRTKLHRDSFTDDQWLVLCALAGGADKSRGGQVSIRWLAYATNLDVDALRSALDELRRIGVVDWIGVFSRSPLFGSDVIEYRIVPHGLDDEVRGSLSVAREARAG